MKAAAPRRQKRLQGLAGRRLEGRVGAGIIVEDIKDGEEDPFAAGNGKGAFGRGAEGARQEPHLSALIEAPEFAGRVRDRILSGGDGIDPLPPLRAPGAIALSIGVGLRRQDARVSLVAATGQGDGSHAERQD